MKTKTDKNWKKTKDKHRKDKKKNNKKNRN